MSNRNRFVVLAIVALAVATVVTLKLRQPGQPQSQPAQAAVVAAPAPESPATREVSRPRLVCLGAGKCVACKAMEPVRGELANRFRDRLEIEYIDVNLNPERARFFRMQLIPTQILFDADGNERDRIEGFISADDLVARFDKAGIKL